MSKKGIHLNCGISLLDYFFSKASLIASDYASISTREPVMEEDYQWKSKFFHHE
ncbi:hypothetical protein GCM10010916_26290 [Paenibacillus abyssi]|uniref:Uncharacterized protein n=1 Tax=Paenibacillus abyssi TaxID=1340531 RepID=A0A917FWF6_9BACL|nr:hypothetical protein GCM10010916_26290 [Paenibacillus abyssi]